MLKDYLMFNRRLHFLSVSERKSRINLFSISNRLIYLSLLASSYCNCDNLLNCCTLGGNLLPSFRGLPFGFIAIPAANFFWFLLYLALNLSSLCIQNRIFPYFSQCMSLLYIFYQFFFIVFYMSVFSRHNKTSHGSSFNSTIGGCFFLLSFFYFYLLIV